MDNNLGNVQPAINPLPQSQVPQNKSNLGRILLMIVSGVLTIVVLVGIGYMLFLSRSNSTIHSAQVYNQPMVPTSAVTPTPQPTNYQINPKDTSSQAINQDAQAVNQDLNNVSSDLNNVDQSFNDQQTNLQ